MQNNIIFLFCIFIFQSNSFTIRYMGGSSIKNCKIKFHNYEWFDIDDCDRTQFNTGWGGGESSINNIHIDYNLGDIINVWIKAFNNVPLDYEDYCCIYMHVRINEYYINNAFDYIYYCTNCDFTKNYGDKTFGHIADDKRLYCKLVRGKEYNFFIRINGYHELDLMETFTEINNYYKIFGNNYYLSESQDNQEINFSSDSILISSYDSKHKVILDELLIKYSFQGYGTFETTNGDILPSSGEIGFDIIFIKPKNIEGNEIFHTKLTAQTISKFGKEKGTSTSDLAEFHFYYCAPGYKMFENKICYKCYNSCYNCTEPGISTNHHCDKCNDLNPYYFYLNNTKNCNPSCKSANKVRKEKTNYICIDKDKCKNYISSDEESCIESCSSEYEFFDNRTGIISQICLKQCNEYISNDRLTCLDSCERINQLIDNITLNKKCTTENLCILNKKFINSDKTSCNQDCISISELQDYRYQDYRPKCLSYEECDRFISYNGEKCVYDCPSESEYYDDRDGNRSKKCLKKEICDSWISSNDTICLNDCREIKELSDLNSFLCVKSCDNDLFFTPELMTCDTQCREPFKYFIKYENKTKKCVQKCEFPYIVSEENNLECLLFNQIEITSIQMNPKFNSNKNKFPTYSIDKGTKDITIKVTFNQNIRGRIKLRKGNFEENTENNNSLIIKIDELNEKQIFNFSDKMNNSYYFGFKIDIKSSFDPLIIILIVVIGVLLVSLIVTFICFHRKIKNLNDIQESLFIELKTCR